MSDDRNPQAFPTDGRIQHGTAYDGMTLRDYFATAAITRIKNPDSPQVLAFWCYQVADAMLAARQEPTS
jgi:hypothetical protein